MNKTIGEKKKKFNVKRCCNKDYHYMVDLTMRLEEIKVLINNGEYFEINKAGRCGKTTMLMALRDYLKCDYIVVYLNFQCMTETIHKGEHVFAKEVARRFIFALQELTVEEEKTVQLKSFSEEDNNDMTGLFECFSTFCAEAEKPVVLLIDGITDDLGSQVFLDFLALLRGYYLNRDEYATFQSVIISGDYNLRKIERMISMDKEFKSNAPWNIACAFKVDMTFSAQDIAQMLMAYENDHNTEMDVFDMADSIYFYTSGHPFLVSSICKIMDEELAEKCEFAECGVWTYEGVVEAVKILLSKQDDSFDFLLDKLEENQNLKSLMYAVMFSRTKMSYNIDNPVLEEANRLGIVKNVNGKVRIANKIFEDKLFDVLLNSLGVVANDTRFQKAKAMLREEDKMLGETNCKLLDMIEDRGIMKGLGLASLLFRKGVCVMIQEKLESGSSMGEIITLIQKDFKVTEKEIVEFYDNRQLWIDCCSQLIR